MSKINIYGQLENQAVDLKLAVTRLIYDENFSKFLSDLNKSFIPLLSGTSLLRPVNPSKGLPFFDKTLGMTIWYNDGVWIDSNGDNADIPRRGDTSERPNPNDVSIGFQYYDTTLKRLLISNGTEWEVDTYTQGNGINIENGVISILLNTDSEGFLTLGANGLKLSGILDAINLKYTKPSSGIPKTDLDSSVLSSLSKADTALLEHQSLSEYAKTSDVNLSLSTKVDKVSGKGLSTNDYTSDEKTKLGSIESGANKTIVDTVLSDTSTNPVLNKVVKGSVDEINTKISWLTIE